MAQHFLHSPAAKTLSITSVMRMTEEEARSVFAKIRWSETNGEPICPVCGSVEAYNLKTRPVWKCKGCSKQFSITSGTIFANRKLPVRDILAGIAIYVNGAKGFSALQLSRDLRVDYKTAFVMLHKVREAIGLSMDDSQLSGVVEIDGMYVGGYVKPTNFKADRKDRRILENQTGKRQVVVAMRERQGRTRVGIAKHEREGVEMAAAQIVPNTPVHADEASHWDRLSARFDIKRVNHQQAYSQNGACTNMAESFFSRVRRAEIGTHHHIAGPYLSAYATEMAWREDFRRTPNGTQFSMVIDAAAAAPVSEKWCGYWQRRAG